MRTIVAGSRHITNYALVRNVLDNAPFEIMSIISGHARGVDQLGERYATEHNIPLSVMPADWDRFGKSAGFIRNERMATCADALVLIWDGRSKGSAHMLRVAKSAGLTIYNVLEQAESGT